MGRVRCDVLVVGAGPAGSAAAIELARAGRDVVVVDRARFPRDKCCGDGLTADALRLLDRLGLDPAAVPSWRRVDDAVVRSPSGRSVGLPLRPGLAAVARRAELDHALVALARDAGAEVVEGAPLRSAAPDEGRVVAEVEGVGRVEARYAVGADGMWSPLRKALDVAAPGYLGEWHAFRQYFRGVGPEASRLHVWFEPDLLPGYAWSFPLAEGVANVGFGVQRGAGVRVRAMAEVWPRLLERPHVRAVLGRAAEAEAPHKAWPIPARVGRMALSAAGGRALFAGDAAAATDPLTGEGIAQALRTGVLAARAVVAAGAVDPRRAARRYEGDVRRAFAADAAMSRLLVHAVRRRTGVRAALRLVDTAGWTRRSFARWLFEDYPRAYLVTPRRWSSAS